MNAFIRSVVIVSTCSLLLFTLPFKLMAQSSSEPSSQGTFSGAKLTTYPEWFKDSFLDINEDVAEAAQEGRRLIYFFHQDGCPYCNALVERNLSQKDIVESIRSNFDVVELNIWGDREVTREDGTELTEKEFADELAVQFTPTMIFYDEQASKVLRLNGYLPPQQFKLALEYVANRADRSISFREYVSNNQPVTPSTRKLITEPFFMELPYNLDRSKSEGKPIAVFFEQADCPNCETLHSLVLTDADTRREISAFDVVQLDMWKNTELITPDGNKDYSSTVGY